MITMSPVVEIKFEKLERKLDKQSELISELQKGLDEAKLMISSMKAELAALSVR